MPIPTNSERPRLNVSVNEVRRQESKNSRQENTFRFAEPFQLQGDQKADEKEQIVLSGQKARAPLEVHFSVRPLKLLKLLAIIMFLTGIFFAGRWSVDGADVFSFSFSAPTSAVVSENAAKNETPVVKEAAKETTAETVKEAAPPEEKDAPKKEAQAAEAKAEAPAASEPESNEPENIITKYSKVALAVPNVKKEWYGDWGKIMQILITIKNNEAGAIKPSYFIMNVEGYDDFDKKIALPTAAQTIKAGEKLDATVNVPNGFAYSPATKGIGDLTAVHIIFNLYDAKDVLITAYETDYNLKG